MDWVIFGEPQSIGTGTLLDFLSDRIVTTSGVPQGSHHGPLLFMIYINDAVDVLRSSSALIYADDIKLFLKIESLLDASLLPRDLIS